MRRLTISMDDDLADTFDRLVKEKGYVNRSEAFRDLLRGELRKDSLEAGVGKHCVGTHSPTCMTITSDNWRAGLRACSMIIMM